MAESYPEKILPKSNYILEMDIPQLLKVYPNLYVARRIDGDKHQLVLQVDGDNILSDAALRATNVANFSVNLIGGLFDAGNHIQYRPLQDDITKPWKGECVTSNDMDSKYEIKEPCFAVYYKIADFINFPLIQEMNFQSENDFMGFKAIAAANRKEDIYLNAFSKGKIVELPVKKKVNHAPTICNYWHLVLDTYPYENPNTAISTSDTKGPYKRILRHLRSDFLTKWGVFEIKQSDTINKCFYLCGRKNELFRKVKYYVSFLKF